MKRAIVQIVLFLTTTTEMVDGHAFLTLPSSKNGGTLSIPPDSDTHFKLGAYGIIDKAFFDGDHSKTPWTKPGKFDHQLATDLIPGHPETLHPCGCNAGNVAECASVVHASGFGETTLGTTVIPPTWSRGSVQETAWNAWANHGGGHIYMLCKKTEFDSCRVTILPSDPAEATQEQRASYLACVWHCFEANTLEWAPDKNGTWSQKIQFQDDHCTYVTMNPMTKVGKDKHLWRFTPIPDHLQVTNGGEGRCMWDSVTSFSSPKARDEFIASFGNEGVCDSGANSHNPYKWHVFDKIVVPADLEEGEYLLSWRWDAYMADQLWTNCADVTITTPDGGPTFSNSDVKDDCSSTPVPSPPTPTPVPTPTPTPVPSPPTPPTTDCPSGYSGIRPRDDCTRYYHCRKGVMVGGVLDCPAGTLFDMENQYCNWASDVTCGLIPVPSPPTPTPVPSPPTPTPPSLDCPTGYSGLRPRDDCTRYYHCQSGTFVGGVSDCPTGTLFDMENQYCNWANMVTCGGHRLSAPKQTTNLRGIPAIPTVLP